MKGSTLKDKAFCIYLNSGGAITKKEIAQRLGITPRTVSNWSKEGDWDSMLNVLTNDDTDKPCDLKASSVIGLLPKQTAHIMSVIDGSSAVDILWQNILLQYAAIIRAQQLMFVDNDEILSLEKRHINDGASYANEWENITPWARYKDFLESQSKAMNVLCNMLNKFEDYKRKGLVNRELVAKIDLIKHKTGAMTREDTNLTVVTCIPRAENSSSEEE